MNAQTQTEIDKIWNEKKSDFSHIKKSYYSFKDGFFKGLTSKAAEKYWLDKFNPVDLINYNLPILEKQLQDLEISYKEGKIEIADFLVVKGQIRDKIHHYTLAFKILEL